MGRIVTSVTIANAIDSSMSLTMRRARGYWHVASDVADCLERTARATRGDPHVEVMTATQEVVAGSICGPVRIEIEGFPPIFDEVLFVDMQPHDGRYEPLIGYVVLEQSQAAVDMLGHRLVHVKWLDLKRLDRTDE